MTLVDKHDERHGFHVGVNVFAMRDGKLLLGKRGNTAGKDQWALPGGHLEFQESIEYAAARELEEETGLTAASFELANLANVPQREKHYLQIGLRADGIQGEPEVLEPERCQAWQWFALDELPEELFFGHRTQILGFVNNELLSDTDKAVN